MPGFPGRTTTTTTRERPGTVKNNIGRKMRSSTGTILIPSTVPLVSRPGLSSRLCSMYKRPVIDACLDTLYASPTLHLTSPPKLRANRKRPSQRASDSSITPTPVFNASCRALPCILRSVCKFPLLRSLRFRRSLSLI